MLGSIVYFVLFMKKVSRETSARIIFAEVLSLGKRSWISYVYDLKDTMTFQYHWYRYLSSFSANDSKVIGQFAKNYLPILFNLYTSGNEDCQGILLSILETIKSFLTVTEEKVRHMIFINVDSNMIICKVDAYWTPDLQSKWAL